MTTETAGATLDSAHAARTAARYVEMGAAMIRIELVTTAVAEGAR
jgi:hypothetical protein